MCVCTPLFKEARGDIMSPLTRLFLWGRVSSQSRSASRLPSSKPTSPLSPPPQHWAYGQSGSMVVQQAFLTTEPWLQPYLLNRSKEKICLFWFPSKESLALSPRLSSKFLSLQFCLPMLEPQAYTSTPDSGQQLFGKWFSGGCPMDVWSGLLQVSMSFSWSNTQ